MPQPGTSLHIASLDYQCTFDLLPPGGGPATFECPDPVHFGFNFETGSVPVAGQPDVVQLSWGYSWFSQAQVESAITFALDQICAAVAVLTGTPVTVVNAAVTVRRVWTFAPNVQGPDVSSGRVVTTDVMAYPHAVTDSDAVAAADGGEHVA
jgi:hypothetical protein